MPAGESVELGDPRLAHLLGNPNISFAAHSLSNHWKVIARLLQPQDARTVRVYCFDGELDDQIRLESVLLHAGCQDRIVVLAGCRIDGQDTLQEMTQVVKRTLHSAVTPAGRVEAWPNVLLLRGGPLLVKTVNDRQALAESVERLARAIADQAFVFHNNTSATFLESLLGSRLQKQIKAITFTCGFIVPPGQVLVGANGSWNMPAFIRCIDLCESAQIPFISLHGSLSGYTKSSLPDLAEWHTVALLPVASPDDKDLFRDVVGFSLAIVLSWLATAIARAGKKDRQAVLAVLEPWLGHNGLLQQSNEDLFSDEWLAFLDERLTETRFSERNLAGIHRRFRSIAASIDFPYCNTIGDLAGCVVDMPVEEDDVLALPLRITEKHGAWSAVLGDHRVGDVQERSHDHYAIVWADESRTLDRAWSRIRTARMTSLQDNSLSPLDPHLKQGCRKYSEVAEELLDGIMKGQDQFPEDSLIWLERARDSLKTGRWAESCR